MDPIVIHDTKDIDDEKHLFPPEYKGHFDHLLIDSNDIRTRVQELAVTIHQDYLGQRPVLICMLKGACSFFIHLTDALQNLQQGYDIEFIRVSSYDGMNSTGNVTIRGNELLLNIQHIQGRHVLIIEDIVDTGTTLCTILPMLQQQGQPTTLEVCTLLDKRLDDPHEKKFEAKYCGFSIPNHFIIGYGLDYNELYRDLKDIFVISQKGIQFDARQLRNNNLDSDETIVNTIES